MLPSKCTTQSQMQISAITQALGLHGDEAAAGVEGTLTSIEQCENIGETFFILALREVFGSLGLGRGSTQGIALSTEESICRECRLHLTKSR